MYKVIPALLTALALTGSVALTRAYSDESGTNRVTVAVAKARGDLELSILKREYESLRLARVEQVKQIEFVKIEMESYKDKSLRQRELKERLEILQEQLKLLDRMIEEASQKAGDAMLKQAMSSGD